MTISKSDGAKQGGLVTIETGISRREVLVGATAAGLALSGPAIARTDRKNFVFVHGAWHNSETWNLVAQDLRAKGHYVLAIDLPGAGPKARIPASFSHPRDGDAFATEPSPNAGITQAERTAATIAAVRSANEQTGGETILVGHSLGGITISPVAETIPDELSAVVYLTAFMLPPEMPQIAMIQHPTMAAGIPPELLIGDPGRIGALRLDTNSKDSAYHARLKEAFYGDVDQATFDRLSQNFHCDEPLSVSLVPSNVTIDNFGRVPRHYIECTQDRAIVIDGQREMIRLMDEAMSNPTTVHALESSHSPFYSMPKRLVEVLETIAT